MSSKCVQLVNLALPYDSSHSNMPCPSLHDVIELAVTDFRLLGNPKFARCQTKEHYHQVPKHCIPRLPPGVLKCNGALANSISHILNDFELADGRWNDDGSIDCSGENQMSSYLRNLVDSRHYLTQRLLRNNVPPLCATWFPEIAGKVVYGAGTSAEVYSSFGWRFDSLYTYGSLLCQNVN